MRKHSGGSSWLRVPGGAQLLEIITVGAVTAALWCTVRLEQIHEGECGLVLRFGRYRRTVGPGPCLLLRGVESLTRVSTKIVMFTDLAAENCQTSDGALVTIRYHLMLHAAVPARVLKIEKWQEASLAQAEVVVRCAVNNHSLVEMLGERLHLGAFLSAELDQVTHTWGAAGEIEIADVLILRQQSAA
jgi:regulator of protease activity HflC (stomatin/prohibitin superfamily)